MVFQEPPRSCDECGRAFIRQDCLLRHMRTKHRDMLEEILAEAEKKKLQAQLLVAANESASGAVVSGTTGPEEKTAAPPKHVLDDEALADSVSCPRLLRIGNPLAQLLKSYLPDVFLGLNS